MEYGGNDISSIHVEGTDKAEQRETDLLTQLKNLAGIGYLSDLHSVWVSEALYEAIRRISPRDYTLTEWEKAIEYILKKEKVHFENEIKAYQFLCEQVLLRNA